MSMKLAIFIVIGCLIVVLVFVAAYRMEKVNSAQTTEELKKMYAELLKENSMLRTQLEQLLPSAIYVKTDKEKSK